MMDNSPTSQPRHLLAATIGIAIVALAAIIGLTWRLPPDATDIQGARIISILMVWGALWGAGLFLIRDQTSRGLWITVIGAAVLARFALLGATPLFSDDIWRYLWEAKVQVQGHSPFATAPLEFAGSPLALQDPYWPHINHPEISAIYPPVAQIAFLIASIMSYTPVAMKAVMVVADLLGMILLISIVKRRGGNPLWAAIAWGWCPLVCFEVAGASHLDTLAVMFILYWIWALDRQRDITASVVLGLAIASKLIPILLIPLAFRFHRRWWTVLIAPVLVGVLYIPYLDWHTIKDPPPDATVIQRVGLEGPTRALRQYTSRWRHNDALFFIVYEGVIKVALTFTQHDDGVFDQIAQHERGSHKGFTVHAENPQALKIAKIICNIALLIALGLIVWRARSVTTATLWTFGLWLLLSPVIHPWYVLLVLPLAIIERSWAWMLLSVTTLLTYATVEHFLQTGEWRESTLAWGIQWGTFFAVLLICFMRRRRSAAP